jgi:hypothetical protein
MAQADSEAMMDGDGGIVTGWQNKLHAATASVAPASFVAKLHERLAAPGTGRSATR